MTAAPRVKKILFLTGDTEISAGPRVRVYQYIPYLEKAGIRCFVIPMMRHASVDKTTSIFWRCVKLLITSAIRYCKVVLLSIFCDVVFIQETWLAIWSQNFIRLLNKNIVYEFDDAIYVPDPKFSSARNAISRKRLCHMLKICKGVVLTNEQLKQFTLLFNKNVLIITGPIDCRRYSPKAKKHNKHITIGWIGAPQTTFFLEPLSDVFKKIGRHYPNVVVELIGASALKNPSANIRILQWTLDSEVENLHNFDIGIMPLIDSEQARGKGGYKLLQYMAIGIPCVASPVGINSILIEEGVNGYLADSQEQWYEKLQILIDNKSLRESMGAKGRAIAEQRYSLQTSAPKLIEFIAHLANDTPL